MSGRRKRRRSRRLRRRGNGRTCAPAAAAGAQPAQKHSLTIAVLGFDAGESLPKDMGANLSTLLAAYLSTKTDAQMVERAELTKTLGEQGLSLSGMVNATDAVKVGHLVGANVLVTGRAFSLGGNDMTIVVKIIGAETGRVYGCVVKSQGPQDVDTAVTQLAAMVADVLSQHEKSFLAPTVDDKARSERIKQGPRPAEAAPGRRPDHRTPSGPVPH